LIIEVSLYNPVADGLLGRLEFSGEFLHGTTSPGLIKVNSISR